MKKRILCMVLVCFIVVISLPLSALAEEEQVAPEPDKEISEIPIETVEENSINLDGQGVDMETKGTEKDSVIIKSADDMKTEELSFYSSSDWSYSYPVDNPDKISVSNYYGSEETITVPTEYNGKKIVGVAMYNGLPDTVKTMIVPEGIQEFWLNGAPGLESLDLPSTILGKQKIELENGGTTIFIQTVGIRNTALKNMEGLKKATAIAALNLEENKNLTDISILKKFQDLESLYIKGCDKLTDAKLVSLLRFGSEKKTITPNDVKWSIEGWSLKPSIYREDRGSAPILFRDELTVEIENRAIATFKMKTYDVNNVNLIYFYAVKNGATKALLKYEGLATGATMDIEVTGVPENPNQTLGNQVENLPKLFTVHTNGESRMFALYKNGEFWMISNEKQTKIMNNVKKCVSSKYDDWGGILSYMLIEDKEGMLWTLEIGEDGVPQLSKRVENVVKYENGVSGVYALDASQRFWSLGDDNQNLYNTVKDFVVLTKDNRKYQSEDYGVMVLKNDGELLARVDSTVGASDGQFILLETGVDSLIKNGGFFCGFEKDGDLYSCNLSTDTETVETVNRGEGIKSFYEFPFYEHTIEGLKLIGKKELAVHSDGTTWCQQNGTVPAYQVLDTELKAHEVLYASFDMGCVYLLDEKDNLYRWVMDSNAAAQKIAEGVKTLYEGICLTEDGNLYQLGTTSKEIIHKDVEQIIRTGTLRGAIYPDETYDIYLLKKNHTLYRNEAALLTDVADVIRDISPGPPRLNGIYIVRKDGTIWYSSGGSDPTPYKVADYQAEIPVSTVKLNQSAFNLTQGYTAQLQAIIEPENATNQKVSWTSSHPDIATVENGLVTGVKEGAAVITVTTEDGNKTAECKVTVKKAAPVLNPDGGMAEGIVSGETGQNFVDKLKENSIIGGKDQVNLLKADGQEVSLDTPLATGMKVVITIGSRMFNRNAAGTQEYTIVVLGDITGDGNINIMDMLAAQDDILGKEKLEGCYRTAADITGDDAINIMDMLAIQDDILGKEKINPYL